MNFIDNSCAAWLLSVYHVTDPRSKICNVSQHRQKMRDEKRRENIIFLNKIHDLI